MIVRWGALRHADGLSPEDFEQAWLQKHVPLVQHTSGLRQYFQNVVSDAEHRSTFMRGQLEYDGFAQLEFDSINAMRESMERIARDPRIDISHFAAEVKTFACVRKFDRIPKRLGSQSVKRISLLKRATGVSASEFQSEWWGEHSRLVAKSPGYSGYAQNLVIEQIGGAEHHEPAVDGVVELWFPSMDALDEFYGSDEFVRVAAHGEEFIGEITTYLVTEYTATTNGGARAKH